MEFTEQEYLLEVSGPDAEAVFEATGQLNQIDWIEWAAPNTAFQPKLCNQAVSGGLANNERLLADAPVQDANNPGVFPNDEYFPMQWHLYNTGQSGGTPGADIRAPEAWEITTGDPNIVVAVIDTGVDSNHPDLVDNLVPGYDFYENDDKPDPALDHPINTHGTALAGLIAAQGNNEIGVTGVSWKCRIMPIRIFIARADGKQDIITEAEIATALRWAANNGADVLSNSWLLRKSPMPICHSAILDVTKAGSIGRDGKGCVVLFAAGNDSGAIVWYPPKYPEVITVGATDHNDISCYYSSYGPELDIVAPSSRGRTDQDWVDNQGLGWLWTTDIVGVPGRSSTHNSDPSILDYIGSSSGTSSSSPIVAGVAALILSVDSNLTNLEVQRILYRSARDLGEPGWDQYYGWGRVDARAALDMVLAKRADLNNDWKVDIEDLLILIEFWRTNEPSADIAPAAKRDGIVDEQDLELLIRYWQTEIPEMNPTAQ
jgi:subtilisin family serine protease